MSFRRRITNSKKKRDLGLLEFFTGIFSGVVSFFGLYIALFGLVEQGDFIIISDPSNEMLGRLLFGIAGIIAGAFAMNTFKKFFRKTD